MLLKNVSSMITVVIFTDICVFCFSILVSVLQKWSLVWCTLKHGVKHNPVLLSHHLNFALVSLFLSVHMTLKFLTLHKPVPVVSYVRSV